MSRFHTSRVFLVALFSFPSYGTTTPSPTSTQQIIPSRCTATTISNVSAHASSLQPVQTVTPLQEPPVVRIQPQLTVLNPPYHPLNLYRDVTTSVQNCCTLYQPDHDILGLYNRYHPIVSTMLCLPVCWPALLAIAAADYCCNPPFPKGQCLGQTMPCCIRSGVLFNTSLDLLASQLGQSLSHPLHLSDLIVIWLSSYFQVEDMTQHYLPTTQPANPQLNTALDESIPLVLGSTVLTPQQQHHDNANEFNLLSFNALSQTHSQPEYYFSATIALRQDPDDPDAAMILSQKSGCGLSGSASL